MSPMATVTHLLTDSWGEIALQPAFDAKGELIERLHEVGNTWWDGKVDRVTSANRLIKDGKQMDARELLGEGVDV